MMPNYGTPPIALDHGRGRPGLGRRRPRVPRLRRRHRGVRARPCAPGDRRRGQPRRSAGSRTRPTWPSTSPACGWPSGWSSCSACPARVFFANSGAEANECALKLARKHGEPIRRWRLEIVASNGSFHGRTLGALSITGNPAKRDAVRAAARPGHASSTTATSTALRAAVDRAHRRGVRRADAGRGRRRVPRRPATSPRPAQICDEPVRCWSSTRCRAASAAPGTGSPAWPRASGPT